jgi:hypothetical protein
MDPIMDRTNQSMHPSYQMGLLFDGQIRRRERMGGRRVVLLERKEHRMKVNEREKKKTQMVRSLTTTNQKAK